MPRPGFPVLHRRYLIDLIDRATLRRVTQVCAPAGAGKTVACSTWAAARNRARRIAWVALESPEDQPWFWAGLCSALKQVSAGPPGVIAALESEPAGTFPLLLADAARLFTGPVVLVIDNAHQLTGSTVVQGVDLLARHAPPGLRLILSGRQPVGLRLDRLRACGELAEVGAAHLPGPWPVV